MVACQDGPGQQTFRTCGEDTLSIKSIVKPADQIKEVMWEASAPVEGAVPAAASAASAQAPS